LDAFFETALLKIVYWRKTASILIPIQMTEPPALDELLKKLFCGCRKVVKLVVAVES